MKVIIKAIIYLMFINPIIQMGATTKTPTPLPNRFSPAISRNVGISPQNCVTFSFDPFAILLKDFNAIPSASPKLLNLNQDYPLKKRGFSGQILIKLRS